MCIESRYTINHTPHSILVIGVNHSSVFSYSKKQQNIPVLESKLLSHNTIDALMYIYLTVCNFLSKSYFSNLHLKKSG